MSPSSDLLAGMVEQAITPEPGCPLTGFIARTGPSVDVHDDLFARMLLVESEGRRIALVSADILGTDIPTATAIRRKIAAIVQTTSDRVMFHATHTHAGPATIELLGVAPVDTAFLARLESLLCDLARKAMAALEPATLSHRRGRAPGVGVVRRWPGQSPASYLLDDTLDLLSVERPDGSTLGLIVTLPCHAVAAGWTRSISADFPGVMVRELKARMPDTVIAFTQGCCGDINPASGVGTPGSSEETGTRLAEAVQTTLRDAIATPLTGPIRAVVGKAQLLYDMPLPREELFALNEASRRPGADAVARAMGEFARRTLATLDSGTMPPGVEVPVQVVTIGENPGLRIVGLPGEPLSALGRMIRESSPHPTVVLGYANGLMGYVADRKAYEDGGYEINESFRYYGQPAAFAPGAGEALVATARRLIK